MLLCWRSLPSPSLSASRLCLSRTAPLFCDPPARCGCPSLTTAAVTLLSCALCRVPIPHSDAATVPINSDLISAMRAAEGAAALRLQMESPVAVCAECDPHGRFSQPQV